MDSTGVARRVRSSFGDKQGVQLKDEDIVDWINDGQRHIVMENEGLLEVTSTTGTTAGIQNVPVPADLLTLRGLRYKGIKLRGLKLIEFDEFIDKWDDATINQGTPVCYTEWAGQIMLFPIPNLTESNVLKIYYTRQPVEVADVIGDAIDLPLSYHTALVNYVLQQAYEKDEDWEGHQRKGQQIESDVNQQKHREKDGAQDRYPTITTLPEDAW
jgi:hypothetical protein